MRLILTGSSRNGTTITTKILNQHPKIWLTNEFRTYMFYHQDNYFQQLANKINTYHMMPPGFNNNNFVRRCKEKSDGSSVGKIKAVENTLFDNNWHIFGDKGIHADNMKELTDLGLDFRLIIIHRDGRDVVASGLKFYQQRQHGRRAWHTSSPYENSLFWAEILGDKLKLLESGIIKDYLIIRFEDYIDHPGKIAIEIANYLGINKTQLINGEKALINMKDSNRGYYRHWCPDWQETFAPEALELLEKLNYI